ncbi:Fe(3+)-hydroxamate ABC transporter permease FhuB [Thioclava kandeliae]|uniref:Fe(3+)-hydroxamate ABC transporter permease FhuB n=1 Tax=Thioclava kandeliae TaxID=3070818 RepID=A0ABV1SEP4_9RHOB
MRYLLLLTLLVTLWLWGQIPPAGSDPITALLFYQGTLPRGVVALLAGALLGLSGVLMQTVLRNPIADPSSLGLSAGAQLALIIATLFFPDWLVWGRWPFALVGAFAALALVMGLGARGGYHPVSMVVTGMLVAMLASGLGAALVLGQGEYLYSLVIWTGGSLVQTDWQPARVLAAVLALGALGAGLLRRPLAVLSLGAEAGQALGQNVALIRLSALVLATVLAASVSAFVGLIGFVGLAGPALAHAGGARSLRETLVWGPFCGALLLFGTDVLLARITGAGDMFPTGAVVGLIGGPLLIWMMRRMRAVAPAEGPRALPRARRPVIVVMALAVALPALVIGLALSGRTPDGWLWLDPAQAAAFLPGRLTRLCAVAAAGGLLALTGAVLQRLSANPLASPEVLGVSGGASMGYGLTLFGLGAPSAAALYGASALGGALALGVLLAMIRHGAIQPQRVLLAGVSVSALAGAVLTLLMASGGPKAFAILAWLSGSAAHVTVPAATGLCAALVVLSALGLLLARGLTVLSLGPAVAGGLGAPLRALWALCLAVAALATGVATVLVGPVSFVGLVAPHLARHLGLATTACHILGSILTGALLMVLADFGARMLAFPYDLPLGLFASLVGTPWLLWLMLRK